jgi:uncharacterized protein (DUF4415 family)
MPKRARIASYTAEELAAMRARGEDRTDWACVDAKTEAELAADTKADPAWAGIPDDWCAHARAGLPLPLPKENKRQVTLRLDPDVLDHFRRQGRGWQSRINAVLRAFVQADRRDAS